MTPLVPHREVREVDAGMCLALHRAGLDAERIGRALNVTRKAVATFIAAANAGDVASERETDRHRSDESRRNGIVRMLRGLDADARVDLLTRALSEYLDDDGEPSGHADHLDAKESVF